MPLFIIHRINTVRKLKQLPLNHGIEVDVRDYKNKIILSHDPFSNGDSLKKLIENVNKRMTIVNVKSYGLIDIILKKIKNKKNFYFLDLSFSEIDKLVKKGLSNKIILRFSKYEYFDLKAKSFKDVEWIWYDYFDKKPITKKNYKYIKENKKKICIVSTELLGESKKEIFKLINYLNNNKFKIEAVCTKEKYINYWRENYNYD